MQTWTHEKLISALIKAYIKMPNRVDGDDEIHIRRLDNLNTIQAEILRRLNISDIERRKIYKNGYDQGRFDEDIERDHGMIRERKPLENGIEITCQIEYAGRLPKRERAE